MSPVRSDSRRSSARRRKLLSSRAGARNVVKPGREDPLRAEALSAPRPPRQIPAAKPYAVPRPGSLQGIVAEMCKLPNVVGYFVGHKVRKGRYTKQLALCMLVSQKPDEEELPLTHRIPKEVSFKLSAHRSGTLKTDVILLKRPFVRAQAAAVAGPGDTVTFPQPGTVGIVMQHPKYGRVITSAGHAFVKASWSGTATFPASNLPRVTLRNSGGRIATLQGKLLKVVVEPRADYALVRPLNIEAYNTFQDRFFLRGTYAPSEKEMGHRLFVLTGRGQLATKFRGQEGSVLVGPMHMKRVLLTDRCTRDGDSGACLIDEQGRVWGLLLGFNDKYSVFMSADIVLFDERADYA